MQFKTTVTRVEADGVELIRGQRLPDLIAKCTFAETIFLILVGKLPTAQEKEMFEAVFTAIIDHGPGTPSALCARISASAKNSMHTALAAGVLGFGERHGVALEAAMQFFYDHVDEKNLQGLLTSMKEQKKYVPGFGHRLFTTVDPRTEALFNKARSLGIAGTYCTFVETVHHELNAISSKPLPINIDGALAAILCNMGIDPRLGKGIFIIGRMPGLVAQVYEEMVDDPGMRRLEEDEISY